VQVNGIRKGAVGDVQLVSGGVLIRLVLASDVTLTRDCVVSIRNVGLMGEKVIAVDLVYTGPAYTTHDTIPGVYEKGVPEVMAALGPAMSTIPELTDRLQHLADAIDRNGDLGGTLKNMHDASTELKAAVIENRRALRTTVENFQASSKTVRGLTT